MITLQINGLEVSVDEGATLLEAAQFLGFPIPTLCHMEGLSPYGACRLCVVEIGEGPKATRQSDCASIGSASRRRMWILPESTRSSTRSSTS